MPNRLMDSGEREKAQQALRIAIDTGKPFSMECRIVRPDGVIRCVESRGGAYYDACGKPLRVFGTIQDVTERKNAESERKYEIDSLRKQLHVLMDTIPAGVFISDADGKLLHINRYARQIWGHALPPARNWMEYSLYKGCWSGTGKRLEAAEWPASRALTKGETVLGEAVDIERFDGTRGTILVCASPARDLSGNITGSIAINLDITAQRKAEEALKASADNFRIIYENSPIGIIVGDMDGRVLQSNPAAEKILGYTKGELLGKVFSEFTHPDDLMIEMPLLSELKNGKRDQYIVEKRYIRKDGRHIWVKLTCTLYTGSRGETLGFAMVEDIGARKRNEEQIKKQNIILQAINRIHETAQTCATADKLIDKALRIVEELTGSPVAFIGEAGDNMNSEVKTVILDKQCCIVRLPSGRVVTRRRFFNQDLLTGVLYSAKPLCTVVPASDECPPDERIGTFLGIPFIQNGRVRGILAVANRMGGYEPEHQEMLETLTPSIFLSLLKLRGEEAARENEQLMRTIMDSASDFLFVKDRESRVLMVNKAYGEVFGVDINDVLGKNDYELYPDAEMAKGVIENDRYVMRTGKTLVCQEGAMTANGLKTYQLVKVPWKDTKDRVMGVLGIAHDVTELKNAKDSLEQTVASLRMSKAYIHILYETTGRLLCSRTPREEIDSLCGKVMKFLDCHVFFNYLTEDHEEMMHLNACGGVSEQQREEIEYLPLGAAVCGCVVRDKCRIVSEHIQTTCDPRTELVKSMGIRAYACHPLLMHDKALGSLSFGTRTRDRFTDDELMLMKSVAESVAVAISRKQDEETLVRQAEELRVADRHKNEFLSTLSHELRNPLATISMGLSLLEATEDREQQSKALQIMERQVGQLCHLVDDLLNLTRITRNKIILKKERLDLTRLVISIAEDYQAQFEDKQIRFHCSVPHVMIWVEADPVRVKQIVGNVVANALKFTDSHGDVELSVGIENGSAAIRVKDTGRGIDAAFLELIFDPFTQADNAIDRKNGGLGLGLSIVKGIAELHGGSVSAASAGRGKGAEFTIRLPIMQN